MKDTNPLVSLVRADGARVAVRKGLVALAVQAMDEEKKTPVIGGFLLLPTRDYVQSTLTDLCRDFDLVTLTGVDGLAFAIAPAAVAKLSAEPGAIDVTVVEIRVPGLVPKVVVRGGILETTAVLNREEYVEPSRLVTA